MTRPDLVSILASVAFCAACGDSTRDDADAGAAPDAGTQAPDGGESEPCESFDSFGGFYAGVGSCSDDAYRLDDWFCVRQDRCDVTVSNTSGRTLTGRAGDAGFSFESDALSCTAWRTEDDFLGPQITYDCSVPDTTATCGGDFTQVEEPVETLCCDVEAQSCVEGERCQLVMFYGSVASTMCIPVTGNVGEGERCERTAPNAVGYDDCAKGLLCSFHGSPSAAERRCLPLCTDSSQCAGGESCIFVLSAPPTGDCTPTCSPFAAVGAAGDCPAGTACRFSPALAGGRLASSTYCAPEGTNLEGYGCAGPTDCARGLTCHDGLCAPFCDAANGCDAGATCTFFPAPQASGVEAELGVCVEREP